VVIVFGKIKLYSSAAKKIKRQESFHSLNMIVTDFKAIINPTFLPKNKLERIIAEPADPRGDPLLEQLLV